MINFIVGTFVGAFIAVIIIGVCHIAAEDAVKDKEDEQR